MEIITYMDQILPHVGEFELYQFILLSLLCLLTVPCTFQTLITYFIAYDPPWQCVANSTKCKLPGVIDKTAVDMYKFRCNIPRQEWEYTEDKYYSIVTEFDLNCEREYLTFVSTSMFFIGMALGAFGIGFLGDKYGRAKITKPVTAICLIVAFLSSFAPNYWVFAFSRFLIGCLAPGTVVMFFILASEMVGPRYRPLAGIALWMFFTLGLIILGLVAMVTDTWKMLMIYSTAPYFVLVPLLFFIPESLRWLHVNNNLDECYTIINRIARVNGKQQPDIHISPPKISTNNISPVLLFSSKEMFLKSMNVGFAWMISGLVYYGATLASKNLTGQYHRDFILSTLVEFPAAVVAIFSAMYLGRKRTTQVPFFLGGIFIAAVSIIDESDPNQHLINTRLFFGLAGKFFLTLSYDVIYTWTIELYPTQIRTEAICYVQITSRIGASASSWIAEWLRSYHWRAPFIVMGVLAVVTALCLQFLPETKDFSTPEWLESELPEVRLRIMDNKKARNGQKLSLVQEEEMENDEY